MKLYQHIVNNRPFCYAVGKDSEMVEDLKSFLAQAERIAGTTFVQSEDRCEDNIDFFGADGHSNIHVITLSKDMIERNS